MNSQRRKRHPWLLAVLAAVLFCLLAPGDGLAKKKKKHKPAAEIGDAVLLMDPWVLQEQLMEFSDRLASRIALSTRYIENRGTPYQQFWAHQYKLSSSTDAWMIASAPNPGEGLLNMMVLVGLGRLYTENYWAPEAFGEELSVHLIDSMVDLEAELDLLAARALTENARSMVHDVIVAWYEEHTDEVAFYGTRLGNLDLATNEHVEKRFRGLFKGIGEATSALEETRIIAERALFHFQRMPVLLEWHAVKVAREFETLPSVQATLEEISGFRESAGRYADFMEQLPDKLSRERYDAVLQVAEEADRLKTEALNQAFAGIAAERRNTIEQFLAEEERVGGLLTTMRGTFTEANTLVTSVQGLVDTFEEGEEEEEAGAEARPFDITEYESALVEAGATIRELNTLVQSTDATTPRLAVMVEEIIDHGFRAAAILIVLLLAGSVVAGLLYHALARRMFGAVPR